MPTWITVLPIILWRQSRFERNLCPIPAHSGDVVPASLIMLPHTMTRRSMKGIFLGVITALILAFGLAFDVTPAGAASTFAAPLCGEGSPPDYGFTYELQQAHWTVGWEGYASEQAVSEVDIVLDQLNADSIAQTMILIQSQAEVGNRVNCAVHFLRYMQLGEPSGLRKDNGFVFLIVVEPTRIDVHYGVGLGLPALTAAELTDLNRAAEDAYQTHQSMDEALLTLVDKYDAVARSNYAPLRSVVPTGEPNSVPPQASAPLGILNICGMLCMRIFLLLFLMWGLSQAAQGGISFNPTGSGSGGYGNPFGGRSSGGGRSSSPPTRGGSGSGRSNRGN